MTDKKYSVVTHQYKRKDPDTSFQAAIENLKTFIVLNETASIPHVFDLAVENNTLIAKSSSSVKRAFHVSKSFLESIFSGKSREQNVEQPQQVQQELLNAIVTVRKHYPILEKWKDGSEDQQKAALFAQQVIERANIILNQAKKKPPSLKGRFIKFIYDQLGISLSETLQNNAIELPKPIFVQCDSPKLLPNKVSQKLNNTISLASSQKITSVALHLRQNVKKPAFAPTQNELDLFWMKAITLIKNHAIPVTSIREALSFAKNTPIETTIDRSEETTKSSIISLSQTLTLFPGEEIELRGSFKRDALSTVLSVPIPDSFHLSSKSLQTGFPHPLQYHGAALSDKLIPTYPLRLDLLPSLQKLLTCKKRISYDLLPNGKLISRAKELVKLKREAFNENRKFFLGAHHTLSKAIFNAAEMHSQETEVILESYFQFLREQESPFDQIAITSHLINELFIVRPCEKLEKAWQGRDFPEFEDPDLTIRAQKVENILIEKATHCGEELRLQHLPEPLLNYILAMGKVMRKGVYPIVMQLWSEVIEFAPPTLTDFSQLMQEWLYRQILAFHKELEQESEWKIEQMKQLLQVDVDLFNTKDFDSLQDKAASIVHELEDYFLLHFSTHTKLQYR